MSNTRPTEQREVFTKKEIIYAGLIAGQILNFLWSCVNQKQPPEDRIPDKYFPLLICLSSFLVTFAGYAIGGDREERVPLMKIAFVSAITGSATATLRFLNLHWAIPSAIGLGTSGLSIFVNEKCIKGKTPAANIDIEEPPYHLDERKEPSPISFNNQPTP